VGAAYGFPRPINGELWPPAPPEVALRTAPARVASIMARARVESLRRTC
jgi:hypothetical protein